MIIIPIKPVSVITPNTGLVKVVQVQVGCINHELGENARFSWEAQSFENLNAETPELRGRPTTRANGQYALTKEEFAAWGTDDRAIALLVISKAGLEPAEPPAAPPV